jgi:YD repeat-containing protein
LRQQERTSTTRTYNVKGGYLEREVVRTTYTETIPASYSRSSSLNAGGFWYDTVPATTIKRTVVTTTRTYDSQGRLLTETIEDGPEPFPTFNSSSLKF